MALAKMASQKTHCYSREVGSVIIRGKRVVSTGYNGPPMGVSHCETRHPEGKKECPRRYAGYKSGEGLHMCPASHAEANAILFAARYGVNLEGTTLYLYDPKNGMPCKDCAKHIIQAGIKEVVVLFLKEYDERPETIRASSMFEEVGIKVREFSGKIPKIIFEEEQQK